MGSVCALEVKFGVSLRSRCQLFFWCVYAQLVNFFGPVYALQLTFFWFVYVLQVTFFRVCLRSTCQLFSGVSALHMSVFGFRLRSTSQFLWSVYAPQVSSWFPSTLYSSPFGSVCALQVNFSVCLCSIGQFFGFRLRSTGQFFVSVHYMSLLGSVYAP